MRWRDANLLIVIVRSIGMLLICLISNPSSSRAAPLTIYVLFLHQRGAKPDIRSIKCKVVAIQMIGGQ